VAVGVRLGVGDAATRACTVKLQESEALRPLAVRPRICSCSTPNGGATKAPKVKLWPVGSVPSENVFARPVGRRSTSVVRMLCDTLLSKRKVTKIGSPVRYTGFWPVSRQPRSVVMFAFRLDGCGEPVGVGVRVDRGEGVTVVGAPRTVKL